MTPDKVAEELFAEISKIPCINSHSHLFSEEARLSQDVDALVFFQHAYPLAFLSPRRSIYFVFGRQHSLRFFRMR